MRPYKFLYLMASFLWGAFSISSIGFFFGLLSFERLVFVALLLITTLLEEIYYMIEEKVIHGKQ